MFILFMLLLALLLWMLVIVGGNGRLGDDRATNFGCLLLLEEVIDDWMKLLPLPCLRRFSRSKALPG